MNDMSATIVAKSDQINAGDLKGISRTVTIKEVRIKAGEDQPVSILIEGDAKAFRPCKGVRRLLVRVWGADASKYIGQSLTLFCDPTVTWAGKEEGGIRVSHMTGLDEPIVEYMRTSRAATKPYKILPLQTQRATQPDDTAAKWAAQFIANVRAATSADAVNALRDSKQARLAELQTKRPNLHSKVEDAIAEMLDSFGEKRAEADMGEGFNDDLDFGDDE